MQQIEPGAPKVQLNKLDFQSDSYRKMKQWALERIAWYHARLEDINLSPERTAAMRGAIAELRYLSALERHHDDMVQNQRPASGDFNPEA